MVILLGLAAAMLYGTGDFLGGLAARRVQVLAVLMLAETAGVIVALPAAVMSPGPARQAGVEDDQACPADQACADSPGQAGQARWAWRHHRSGERDDHSGGLGQHQHR